MPNELFLKELIVWSMILTFSATIGYVLYFEIQQNNTEEKSLEN